MYDIVIIGGGIVGLSTAYQIVQSFPNKKVLVLDKENKFGFHQSGNNSGVIHSGIYYRPGSLKAQNCRLGIKLLKDFCDKFAIKYDICGKIIVARNNDELKGLKELFERGKKNNINDIKLINKDQISHYEPYAIGEGAIYCGDTGIIDYSLVCDVLSKQVGLHGSLMTGTKVIDILGKDGGILIQTSKKDIRTKFLINCAGLFSDKIAELAGVKREYRIVPFRGEYYMLKEESRHLVKNLIYPLPDPRYPFLGVHFTRTIHGDIEAGPNAVLAWSREGYEKFDINLHEIMDYLFYRGFWKMANKYWITGLKEYYRSVFKAAFVSSLKKLIPEISKEDLVSSPAGVRAQALSAGGNLIDDFVIKNSKNMIHVINAPSPAATSSLAIGENIKKIYQSLID